MSGAGEVGGALGEKVIRDFKEGTACGIANYEKMCKALSLIKQWQKEAVVNFVTEIANLSHMLDADCDKFVKMLMKIDWQLIPPEVRSQFIELLMNIAVQHICHLEDAISCFIDYFYPLARCVNAVAEEALEKNAEVASIDKEQNEIYDMAHRALNFIYNCYPMARKIIKRCLLKSFPHASTPQTRYVNYLKNLLFVMGYMVEIRDELWCLIIDNLAALDAVISREIMNTSQNNHNFGSNGMFFLDEELSSIPDAVSLKHSDKFEKLDSCISYIFMYIAKCGRATTIPDLNVDSVWFGKIEVHDEIFSIMMEAFEENILMVHHIQNVPFVWLYLLSLEEEYTKEFLSWLWKTINCPKQTVNDWKRAHGAACYLGSILSRANFINYETSFKWMEKIKNWCSDYLDEQSNRAGKTVAGHMCHGTFYALFQALVVTFCFRYKGIVKANGLSQVQQWGLGKLVHCALQPLRYISKPIAQCFASISRKLQLVYCHHILPFDAADDKIPFEPYFPFDKYILPRSSHLITPLILPFSPLSNSDAGLDSPWPSRVSESMDFLEDTHRDHDLLGDGPWSGPVDISNTANFSIYSVSPGLRHFTPLSPMEF